MQSGLYLFLYQRSCKQRILNFFLLEERARRGKVPSTQECHRVALSAGAWSETGQV